MTVLSLSTQIQLRRQSQLLSHQLLYRMIGSRQTSFLLFRMSVFLSVPQVFEAVPSGVLRFLGGDGGSLLPLHAGASVPPAPRALRCPLRLLWRRLRGADPRGDVRPGGSSVPVLGAGRGLLPPRHPLPCQPANWRWGTKTASLPLLT